MEFSVQLFSIIILIISVVIHEVSHGYAALFLGDETAKYAGRLTLNPVKHISILGSIIVPLLLILLPGGVIFGWAKPVPYNPYNLKNRRWGEAIVAIAGPLSNILIAIIFIVLINLAPALGLSSVFVTLSFVIVMVNSILALFNLIPIPPLDGSKILFSILPFDKRDQFMNFLERWGLLLVLFFIFFIWDKVFFALISFLYFITGINGF